MKKKESNDKLLRMKRIIKRMGSFKVKGSVTVEMTLIMPVVLACVTLLIIMNGYLHDMVVLNGISLEVLYADREDKEKLFFEETNQQLLWLHNVDFSESEDPMKKKISWKKIFSVPLGAFLSIVIDENQIEFSETVQKQAWSMPQVIRYVKQN